jgi:wobble nucleotide-excising tRNase
MSPKNLNPCPFCGAVPEKIKLQTDTYVDHKSKCYFEYFGDSGRWIERGAEAAWSRRAK